jgi:hypothetical protein
MNVDTGNMENATVQVIKQAKTHGVADKRFLSVIYGELVIDDSD